VVSVAAVIGLGTALTTGLLVACSETPTGPRDGETVYRSEGCVQCHMLDGRGSNLAPTLHGKKQHWTRERLIAYVKDPATIAAQDPRLVEQGRPYRLPMPKLRLENPAEYENLADYVLAFP